MDEFLALLKTLLPQSDSEWLTLALTVAVMVALVYIALNS